LSLAYRRPIILLEFRIRLLLHDYPTVQNGTEIQETFNILRHLLLYHLLDFQISLDLRNHFRIQQTNTCKG